jgi:hypothetical protein
MTERVSAIGTGFADACWKSIPRKPRPSSKELVYVYDPKNRAVDQRLDGDGRRGVC